MFFVFSLFVKLRADSVYSTRQAIEVIKLAVAENRMGPFASIKAGN